MQTEPPKYIRRDPIPANQLTSFSQKAAFCPRKSRLQRRPDCSNGRPGGISSRRKCNGREERCADGGSFCGNSTNCRKTGNSLGAPQAKTHLSGTFLDRSAKNLLTVFSGRLTNLIDLPVFCLGQPLYGVAHRNKRQMGVTFFSKGSKKFRAGAFNRLRHLEATAR